MLTVGISSSNNIIAALVDAFKFDFEQLTLNNKTVNGLNNLAPIYYVLDVLFMWTILLFWSVQG